MTHEETLTGNEILAKFMGFDIVSENPVIKGIVCHGRTWKAPVEKHLPYWGGFRTEQLYKFQTSYDWLMPVWKKFFDLEFEDSFEQDKHKAMCHNIGVYILYSPIEHAFEELVKGVKWYNDLKK